MFPAPHTLPVGGRLSHSADRWNKTLRMSPWHLRGSAHRLGASSPRQQAIRLSTSPGSKKRVSCTKTLQHYLAIGSVRPLPADTQDGLWSTFFPVSKKGTDKMRGCVDLRCPNECIRYEHFKMEGLHPVAQLLRRNDYITKIDISDF